MRDIQLEFITNRTTKRVFRLLNMMERNRLFTIGELAEKMEVTPRTIANDLKYMKNYFGDCIDLNSGSSGFLFDEKKPMLYQKRKRELLENECLFEIIGNIFLGIYSRIDELAHHYHFSESTFRRVLDQPTAILASYDLMWSSNPLTLEGDEANLRKFFKDFYYEGVDTVYTIYPDRKLRDMFLRNLDNKLDNYEIGSGTTPAAFYYSFYIAIKRASCGFSITVSKYMTELASNGKNFSLLYSLKNEIKELYEVELSLEEFAWIYLVTICKRTLDREDQELIFYKQFYQGRSIDKLTDAYLDAFELTPESVSTIKNFIRSFFLSRKINDSLSPVLNKEASDTIELILRSDNEHYQRNLKFLQQHQNIDFLSTPYLEDISVSLTIYSNLIFDFYAPKKKIYFLLEGDHFVCQQIRTHVSQKFGLKHELTFLTLQQLTQEILNAKHIDLLVTNYDRYLLDYIIEIDYLLLKPVPDERDWRNLEKKIDPYHKFFSNEDVQIL